VPCDDGNPCTLGDVCAAKTCGAGTDVCDCQSDNDCAGQEDSSLCNGTLFCDKQNLPYQCAVNPKTVVVCDSTTDTSCMTTQCLEKTGECVSTAKPDNSNCDADDSGCTQGDACKNGLCAKGLVVDCDDANPCTTDGCDGKFGCTHVANWAGAGGGGTGMFGVLSKGTIGGNGGGSTSGTSPGGGTKLGSVPCHHSTASRTAEAAASTSRARPVFSANGSTTSRCDPSGRRASLVSDAQNCMLIMALVFTA
jgi:hypothetical protein